MTTAATSLLGLALPVTGELSGTWGDTVNNSITSLLDTAVAGTTTLSTDGDVTLSTTTLAANQARQAILLCSGARTAIRTITAPAQSKIYTIINATTGGYAVKLVGVGPTTGLTIPNGASAVVAWNGSDFIEIGSSTIGNLTVNGNLTVTGTTTLSGGTANGVAYLNGSKVVTTGSALTFDGTNLGVGLTPSGSFRLEIGGADGTQFAMRSTGTTSARIRGYVNSAESGVIGFLNGGGQYFEVAGSEAMRLTSTGLGIGTSSPATKLDVNGSISISSTGNLTWGGAYGAGIPTIAVPSAGSLGFYPNGSTSGLSMVLNSSGNLGIGVTPSAWSGVGSVLQVGTSAAIIGNSVSSSSFLSNAYYDGSNYKYIGTGYAARLALTSGAYAFQTAASGTAGNAISFTQAMTLDASGNLGLGVTSLTQRFQVELSQNASTWAYITNGNNGSGAAAGVLFGTDQGASGALSQNSSNVAYGTSANALRVRNLLSAPITLETGGTERARIDSSGNLGLGVTPSAWGSGYRAFEFGGGGSALFSGTSTAAQTYLTANAYFNGTNWIYKNTTTASFYEQSGGVHKWYYAGSGTAGTAISFTSAMTLDASGRLSVATTNPTGGGFNPTIAAKALSDSIGGGIMVEGSGADATLNMGYDGVSMFLSSSYRSTAGYKPIAFYTSGSEKARITTDGNFLVGATATINLAKMLVSFTNASNGLYLDETSNSSGTQYVRFSQSGTTTGSITRVLQTSAVNYNTSSDYRLKENVQPMIGAIERVNMLNPVTYDWKESGVGGEGFIAHELAEIMPQAVTGEKDAVDADGNPVYQGIDTSNLVALLTAAIQEQQALITQLTERITALESK